MKLRNIIFVILSVLALSSCKTQSYSYLSDMHDGMNYPVTTVGELKVMNRDRLNIFVTCKEPDLALIFNARGYIPLNTNNVNQAPNTDEKGYKVDKNGCIEFPLIGRLYVAGLTLTEVSELIKRRIAEEGYIKDPMVTTTIINFKYVVMGATSADVYTAPEGEVTLLEALAKAHDIKNTGRIRNVAVVREVNGSRSITHLDLTSKDIFDSPCYHLQQNDIVYVEPKYRTNTTSERVLTFSAMVLSFITSVGTIFYLFK